VPVSVVVVVPSGGMGWPSSSSIVVAAALRCAVACSGGASSPPQAASRAAAATPASAERQGVGRRAVDAAFVVVIMVSLPGVVCAPRRRATGQAVERHGPPLSDVHPGRVLNPFETR